MIRTDGGRDEQTQNLFETGYRHDRQILIVGHGLPAATTAGFLGQQGLDPVLAAPVNSPAYSAVIPIWEPGLSLLEHLGLRRPIEHFGTPLNSLDCLTSGKSWTGNEENQQSLVVIGRRKLQRLLDRQLLDNIRTTEQRVTTTEPGPLGTTVLFDNDVQESFDVVVTTVPSLVSGAERPAQPVTANVWECQWKNAATTPADPTEAWDGKRAVCTVSTGKITHARFISTADMTPPAAVDATDLGRQFGDLINLSNNCFSGLQNQTIQYRQSQRVVPVGPNTARIALAGSAARASLPGDLLGPTRGIEDAWILADTLAFGPSSVAAAIDTYDGRRHRRQLEITQRITDLLAEQTDHEFGPVIRRLRGRRRLVCQHIFDGTLPAVAQSIRR